LFVDSYRKILGENRKANHNRPKLKIDETKVLALRSQGKHIKEIASELDVSTPTVTCPI